MSLGGRERTFDVLGASRLGWQIGIIGTPTSGGRSAKEPGLIEYPAITLRGLSGDPEAARALRDWANGADPEDKNVRIDLVGLGGEFLRVNLPNVEFLSADPTLTEVENDQLSLEEVRLQPVAYSLSFYEAPSFPPCPRPGYAVDEGFREFSCYNLDALDPPADGTSDAFVLDDIRGADDAMQWMLDVTRDVDAFATVRSKRDITISAYDENVDPVGSIRIQNGWPSRITLFDPTETYGEQYLISLEIVNDWVVYMDF